MMPKIISFLLYLRDFFNSFDYSVDGGVIFGRIVIPTYFLINLSLNDDSGYRYWGVEQFNNDLIIGFTANKKSPPKDPYSRVVFLHYESLSNKLFHSAQIRTSHQSYLEIKASFSANIQTMLQTIRVIVILRRLLFKFDCYIYDIFLTAIA